MRNSALEEGERWLSQAVEDLKWTKHLAEQGGNCIRKLDDKLDFLSHFRDQVMIAEFLLKVRFLLF